MPQIVVMIDNYDAFKEYFPEQSDLINGLTREAQGVGISFIVTAATSNAMNYRVQANFGKKFALNCNDTGEYSNMFGHCKATPRENPGRGLFTLDKRILEFQIAIFGKSNKEAERSQELKAYILDRNKDSKNKALQIPMVPEKLVMEEIMQNNSNMFRRVGIIPIGMEFETVEYKEIDINQMGSLSLIGDNECRIQFMKCMLLALARNIVFHNVEAIIIDDKQKSLNMIGQMGFVKTYTNDVTEGLAYIADFYDAIREREESDNTRDTSTIVLVLNNIDVFRQICSDKNMSKELSSAIKQSNDTKSFILMGQVENVPVGFNSSDVLKTLKDERKGIVFAPISDNKFYEITGRIKQDTAFDRSMGYIFTNAGYTKLKIFE